MRRCDVCASYWNLGVELIWIIGSGKFPVRCSESLADGGAAWRRDVLYYESTSLWLFVCLEVGESS